MEVISCIPVIKYIMFVTLEMIHYFSFIKYMPAIFIDKREHRNKI